MHGAQGQILDNGNGNVCFGVANGTPCKMVSLAWENDEISDKVSHIIRAESLKGTKVIDIPIPPDCIVVEVSLPNQESWPQHLNLSPDPTKIHIPIGLKTSSRGRAEKDFVMLSNRTKVIYCAHAIDLAFAITTWKSQGGTFDYIIALLENSTGAHCMISFELLYVMISRVRQTDRFRCFPMAMRHKTIEKLRRLRPKVSSIKWRKDVANKNGKWAPPISKDKTQHHSNVPKKCKASTALDKRKHDKWQKSSRAQEVKQKNNQQANHVPIPLIYVEKKKHCCSSNAKTLHCHQFIP